MVVLGWSEVVSIHAPAWGATAGVFKLLWDRSEFQSTPPRGGRRIKVVEGHISQEFEVTINN